MHPGALLWAETNGRTDLWGAALPVPQFSVYFSVKRGRSEGKESCHLLSLLVLLESSVLRHCTVQNVAT